MNIKIDIYLILKYLYSQKRCYIYLYLNKLLKEKENKI